MRVLLVGFLLSVCLSLKAQQSGNLRQQADLYFEQEQYHLAIQNYLKFTEFTDQNAEVNYQLAESYRKTFRYQDAERLYLKVYDQAASGFPLTTYYSGLMLKLNGKFDESITSFNTFISTAQAVEEFNDEVEQARIEIAGCEMAKAELLKNREVYELRSERVNTAFNDYAPALRDSVTLVITSGRVESKNVVIDERYGEAFTDNFYFVKNEEAWQNKTKDIFTVTNSRANDGSGNFNGRGDKYYFTVCGKGVSRCRIFLSEFKNDQWTEPEPLNDNINYANSEAKHPAVSKGGDTLLFATNRPGGFGKFDIWMSINAGGENWGPALNCGSMVNTKLNELAPAFTTFSHVFFMASDGHQSYGGLDLYMVKMMSDGSRGLYNLDYPFNSSRDDCFISFSQKSIYFSSNREGGMGGFDIYSAVIPSVISFISKLSLKNKDARQDVKLLTRSENSNNLTLLTARNEDRIEYENLSYAKRKIVDKLVLNRRNRLENRMEDFNITSKEDYLELQRIANTQYKIYELTTKFSDAFLTRVSSPDYSVLPYSITGMLIDSLSDGALAEFKVVLMDEAGEIIKTTTTNDKGKFRFTNMTPGSYVYLRMESIPDQMLHNARITDLQVLGIPNQSSFNFENIFFDFDQFDLRKEAKVVLNDLATYLKKYPSVQVEIYGYADDQGTENYNLALSHQRGQSVLDYLVNQGTDQTSLAVVAKGKQGGSYANPEKERQFNRRVECYLHVSN
jgi:outer membrane protein OmpA-like peptidoglycan-associated protein/tetratricopeptide (TPR) repeat protein